MTTPYVTPLILTNAPTGISWSTIPSSKATPQQQLAEQTDICWRATEEVNRICGQVLRATADIEQQPAPSSRVSVRNTGAARMVLSRWPILSIISGQVSSTMPAQWTPIPASHMQLERITPGLYGTSAPDPSPSGPAAIVVAPGYVDWALGRDAYSLQVTYLNGWPHTSLTAAVAAGATALAVDDVTGWQGVTGVVYDGAETETFTVSAISQSGDNAVPSGPGTLTLAAPLTYLHTVGTLVSSMPANIQWATVLLCCAQALTRGATSTTVQSLPGASTSGGAAGAAGLRAQAEHILQSYARVV